MSARALRKLETFARKQGRLEECMKLDDETRCIGAVSRSLDQLEPTARRRVVRWLMERYVTDPSPEAEAPRQPGNLAVYPDRDEDVRRDEPPSADESMEIARERLGARGGA